MPTLGQRRVVGVQYERAVIKCANCSGTSFHKEGGIRICNGCGKPFGTDTIRTGVSTGQVITNPEEIRRAAGRIEYCQFCGAGRDEIDEGPCATCGADDWGFSEPERQAMPTVNHDEDGQPAAASSYGYHSPSYRSESRSNAAFPIPPRVLQIVGGVAAVIVFALIIMFFVKKGETHDVPVTVTDMTWYRQVVVEESYTSSEKNSLDLPANATQVRPATTEQVDKTYPVIAQATDSYTVTSTPKVIGTTEPEKCTGIATPEEGDAVSYEMCSYDILADPVDVTVYTGPTPVYGTPTPVYGTRYYYVTLEWRVARSPEASGHGTTGVDWPAFTLAANERQLPQNRSESYALVISGTNLPATWNPGSYDKWRTYAIGASYIAKVNGWGTIVDIVPAD